ncbi:MAG TPA: glycosyltransferase family 4 protein [Armatimonadota bacterium]|nr:glycosyltransferase family 4 protein [Armatimonadota bacterium]
MPAEAMQSENLRVLMCNKFFVPVGGAETVMFEELKMLEANGHTVIPFAMQRADNLPSPYSKYFVSQVDYNESGRSSARSLLRSAVNIIYSTEAARKIWDLVREVRPDIAHLHNIYHQLSPSICVALRREGVPMVMTLHDVKLLCPDYLFLRNGAICELCGGGKFYNAVRYKCVKGSRAKSMICCIEMYVHKLFKLYDRNIDIFIAPSEFLRNKLLEYGRLPAEQIVHIPNAIDLDAYTPSYSNQGYCLFVGRLASYKGIMTLMRAMSGNRHVQLRVVGDGDARQQAEEFKKLHSLDNVTFGGFQTGEVLRSIVQGAAFMIVPSECYENCPMTVLEAFATGKPVIGSRLGGIPDIIDDGVNGLLFEPGNADDLAEKISYLAGQPKLLVGMGKAARAKVEKKYSPQEHLESLLCVYEKVIRLYRH